MSSLKMIDHDKESFFSLTCCSLQVYIQEKRAMIFLNFYSSSYICSSVCLVWSVESLPSNSAPRVRFPVGSGILIFILGLGVCTFYLFCLVLSLAVALSFCWPQEEEGSPLCICQVFRFTVCILPIGIWPVLVFRLFVRGGISPGLGRVNIWKIHTVRLAHPVTEILL